MLKKVDSSQKITVFQRKSEFHQWITYAKAVGVFCALFLFDNACPADTSNGGPQVGDVPPPLGLTKTIQGPSLTEISWDKLKGQVVVLEFWATWCGPCLKAIPHLNSLVRLFKGKPVVFLSVTSENEDIVRLFLKSHSIEASVALDDYEVLYKAFQVQGIPHVFIVSGEGRIAAIAPPSRIEAKHIAEVLAGGKCSLPEAEVYSFNTTSAQVIPSRTPPLFEVSIREHKPRSEDRFRCMWSTVTNGIGFHGEIATVESALNFVFNKAPCRILRGCKLPAGYYDFTLEAPAGHYDEMLTAFEGALRVGFRLEVRRTTRTTDAYILTQFSTNAPGLHRVRNQGGGGGGTLGGFRYTACGMSTMVEDLETALGKPVFDETGLTGSFAVDMKWSLSEAERLRKLDPRILDAANGNPQGDWISSLPKDLLERKSLEDAKRLQMELAKPESQQFLADFDAVNNAARTRLGLALIPVRRAVDVIEVNQVHND